VEQPRAFVLTPKDQPNTLVFTGGPDLIETPKKAPKKFDSTTPYFKERQGLEITKLVLSGEQKPSL
jgi:hypothetical protein